MSYTSHTPQLRHPQHTKDKEITDYAASPRATDPVTPLREARIRISHLRALLEHSDQEVAKREHAIQELYLERG
jgi:hypothetical protein